MLVKNIFLCLMLTTVVIASESDNQHLEVDELSQIKAALNTKVNSLKDEADLIAKEKNNDKERSRIKNQSFQQRAETYFNEQGERDAILRNFYDEKERLEREQQQQKERIELEGQFANAITPVINEEEDTFQNIVTQHEAQRKIILDKEARQPKIYLQLLDKFVQEMRYDVLNLIPMFKELLEDELDHSGMLCYELDVVNPLVARKIFTYLESTLIPSAQHSSLWMAPSSEDSSVLEFLKENKDLILALDFLNLLPHRYSRRVCDGAMNVWSDRDKLESQYGVIENIPAYLLEGFLKYDPSLPSTSETIKLMIEADALTVYPLINSYNHEGGRLRLNSVDDINFLLTMPSHIIQEAFHLSVLNLSSDLIISLDESVLKDCLDKKYHFELGNGGSLSQFKYKDDDLIELYFSLPECALKNLLIPQILELAEIKINIERFKAFKGVEELPDDVLNYLKDNIELTLSNWNYLAQDKLEKIMKDFSFDIKTQAQLIMNASCLRSLNKLNKSISYRIFDKIIMGKFNKLPNELKKDFKIIY